MNRKGFTLIELIAVIVLLGILLVLTSPYIITAYENSKLKNEEIFTSNLSKITDDYIKLNSDEITFTSTFDAEKNHKSVNNAGEEQIIEYPVKVNKGTITAQDLINSTLLLEHNYRNAGNKDVECNRNAEIEIYKDSDFVYCHKIKIVSLNCLSEKYIETITGDYVVDTCSWEVTP